MAWTQQDIDNLKDAMATGALRCRVNERDTTFRTLEEMRRQLAMMEEEVAAGAGARKPRQYRFSTTKGLT